MTLSHFLLRFWRREKLIERWHEEREERISEDVMRTWKELEKATFDPNRGLPAASFVALEIEDPADFCAKVVAIAASNLNDECAIGHAVKTLVDFYVTQRAERVEGGRVVTINEDE